MSKKNITIADIQKFTGTHSFREDLMEKILGFDNREEFVTCLKKDVFKAFREIEKNSGNFPEGVNEDHISEIVCTQLLALFYNPTHGENANGETDIIIKSPLRRYEYIAEAKIFYGEYTKLYGGFNQLTTRYTKGRPDYDDSGGLFIYFLDINNIKEKMETWERKLEKFQKDNPDVNDISELKKDTIDFESIHKHDISGVNFETWHVPLMLTFQPKDPSAKKAKKHNSK